MHPDKKKLICELFKDENKTQPANPKKEAHLILADIIKWAFNNFLFLWAHGLPLWSESPSWQLNSWSDVSIPTSIFYACHEVLLKK